MPCRQEYVRDMDVAKAQRYMYALLRALKELHAENVIHRYVLRMATLCFFNAPVLYALIGLCYLQGHQTVQLFSQC